MVVRVAHSSGCGEKEGAEEVDIDPEDLQLHTEGAPIRVGTRLSTGQVVVLKRIRDDIGSRERGRSRREELLALKAWACPELVKYHGLLGGRYAYVVVEYMDLGGLQRLTGLVSRGCQIPTEHLAHVTRSILKGLTFLHDKKTLHTMVEPKNVLHNALGEVKLTAFDKLLAVENVCCPSFPTTYMSPENCCGEVCSFCSDSWSCGLVLYELATGSYAFEHVRTFPELFEALCENPLPRLDPSRFSSVLCDFVEQCLIREVDREADNLRASGAVASAGAGAGGAGGKVAGIAGAGSGGPQDEEETAVCVLVRNLVGEEVFGPRRLGAPLRVVDLAEAVRREIGRPRHEQLKLIHEGRVLAPQELLADEGDGAPLILSLVVQVVQQTRPPAWELLHHDLFKLAEEDAAVAKRSFARWLKEEVPPPRQ